MEEILSVFQWFYSEAKTLLHFFTLYHWKYLEYSSLCIPYGVQTWQETITSLYKLKFAVVF